jgi:hypothetical protein
VTSELVSWLCVVVGGKVAWQYGRSANHPEVDIELRSEVSTFVSKKRVYTCIVCLANIYISYPQKRNASNLFRPTITLGVFFWTETGGV